MKARELNFDLIDSYWKLLSGLSSESKRKLILRLSNSLNTPEKGDAESLKSLYGAFQSNLSSEQIIAELKADRTFNRSTQCP